MFTGAPLEPIFPPMLASAKETSWSDAAIVAAKTSELVMMVSIAAHELRELTEASSEGLADLKADEPEEYEAFIGLIDIIKRQLTTASNEIDARLPVRAP